MLHKPFVAIRWADAHCISGASELSETELPHAAAMYTLYGFVLRRDDVGITVAAEISDNNTYRGISFVPAGMIESVVEYKLTVKKPKKSTQSQLADQTLQSNSAE